MVQQSSHGILSKYIFFPVNLFYSAIMKLITYFLISLFAVVQTIILQATLERTFNPNQTIGQSTQTVAEFIVALFLFVYFSLIGFTMYTSLNYKASDKIAVQRFFSVSTLFGLYFVIVFAMMAYGAVSLFTSYVPEGQKPKDPNASKYLLPNLQDNPTTFFILKVSIGNHSLMPAEERRKMSSPPTANMSQRLTLPRVVRYMKCT